MKIKQLLLACLLPSLLIACSNGDKSCKLDPQLSIDLFNRDLSIDTPIYKLANISEKNKISDAIYHSALIKLDTLNNYEKQLDKNITLEDYVLSSNPSSYLDYCWLGKFVTDYKKFNPNSNDLNTLNWLDNKRVKWKNLIEHKYGYGKDKEVDNYCPH